LCATAADRYHDLLLRHFHQQLREGADAVRLSRLVMTAAPDLTATAARALPPIVTDVVAEFQRRWATLLGPWQSAARHHVDVASVAGPAAELFPALSPRWTNARQHSPDLMIAADGPSAVARGGSPAELGVESSTAVVMHDLWQVEIGMSKTAATG